MLEESHKKPTSPPPSPTKSLATSRHKMGRVSSTKFA